MAGPFPKAARAPPTFALLVPPANLANFVRVWGAHHQFISVPAHSAANGVGHPSTALTPHAAAAAPMGLSEEGVR